MSARENDVAQSAALLRSKMIAVLRKKGATHLKLQGCDLTHCRCDACEAVQGQAFPIDDLPAVPLAGCTADRCLCEWDAYKEADSSLPPRMPPKVARPIPAQALIKCPACARDVSQLAPTCPGCGHPIAAPKRVGTTNRGVYLLLAFFFGTMGVHNLYAGKILIAICQFILLMFAALFLPLIALHWLVALLMAISTTEDGDGLPMT